MNSISLMRAIEFGSTFRKHVKLFYESVVVFERYVRGGNVCIWMTTFRNWHFVHLVPYRK